MSHINLWKRGIGFLFQEKLIDHIRQIMRKLLKMYRSFHYQLELTIS